VFVSLRVYLRLYLKEDEEDEAASAEKSASWFAATYQAVTHR
jgi:hypothetical protein